MRYAPSSGRCSKLRYTLILLVLQDIKLFGDDKNVTAIVSMLEHAGNQGNVPCLTVKAASPSLEVRILGSKLKRTFTEGVGFKVVDSAMPVRVLSVQKHGKIFFYIPEHKTPQVRRDSVEYTPPMRHSLMYSQPLPLAV